MLGHCRAAAVILLFFTAFTGLAYPLAVTATASALFPHQSKGSPVVRDGIVVGSSLIGQSFAEPRYFWGRPSAAGAGYDGRASSGSNLGPTSKALADRVAAEAARHGVAASAVPADLLTASGSGLDPHISLRAARFQISRVAAARGLEAAALDRLIGEFTEAPIFGIFGEERVNVLLLNLALDEADAAGR